MRFFDPKLARKLDDTNDVSAGMKLGVYRSACGGIAHELSPRLAGIGLLLYLSIPVRITFFGRTTSRSEQYRWYAPRACIPDVRGFYHSLRTSTGFHEGGKRGRCMG
jgi:hypothetical protein